MATEEDKKKQDTQKDQEEQQAQQEQESKGNNPNPQEASLREKEKKESDKQSQQQAQAQAEKGKKEKAQEARDKLMNPGAGSYEQHMQAVLESSASHHAKSVDDMANRVGHFIQDPKKSIEKGKEEFQSKVEFASDVASGLADTAPGQAVKSLYNKIGGGKSDNSQDKSQDKQLDMQPANTQKNPGAELQNAAGANPNQLDNSSSGGGASPSQKDPKDMLPNPKP